AQFVQVYFVMSDCYGITPALGTGLATISTGVLPPGRSFPSFLSASAQTWTVVLDASSAGLTCVIFAGTGTPSRPMMLASLPTASSRASFCETCARAVTREVSMTVTTAAPDGPVSPG